MNLPIIVDVVIGLVFIYFILSLLASEIQELIATILQWRSKHLKESITNLLAGDISNDQNLQVAERLTKDLYNHPLLSDMNQEARGLFATLFRKITWIFSWIYRGLTGEETAFGSQTTAPSYLPGETFATALIEKLGIEKLVEALVNAKLYQFNQLILQRVNISEQLEGEKKETLEKSYKELEAQLKEICEQFSQHTLTLEAAIDQISLKVDLFINQKAIEASQKEKLATWKQSLFGVKNELALINGGLKPAIEEITGLLNTSSRTYQSVKEKFQVYYEQREQQLLTNLKGFLSLIDSSVQIIIDPNSIAPKNPKELEEPKNKYRDILIGRDNKINTSISQVNQKLFDAISADSKQIQDKQQRASLDAFNAGFGRQNQNLLLRVKEDGKTILFLVTYITIIFAWVFNSNWKMMIDPFWGMIFILSLIVPVFFLPCCFWLYERSKLKQNGYHLGALSKLLDELLPSLDKLSARIGKSETEFKDVEGELKGDIQQLYTGKFETESKDAETKFKNVIHQLYTNKFETESKNVIQQLYKKFETESKDAETKFKDAIQQLYKKFEAEPKGIETESKYFEAEFKNAIQQLYTFTFKLCLNAAIQKLYDSKNPTLIQQELYQYGQCLHQYCRTLTLSYADVDLPFIPNSVKQSIATLSRRAETKVKRAENEISQLREEIGIWFDRSMDRSSGVYKRNAKGVAILIGFLIATVTNANSIYILQRLSYDKELRQAVEKGAEKFLTDDQLPSPTSGSSPTTSPTPGSSPTLTPASLQELNQKATQVLSNITLPIGWDPASLGKQLGCELPKEAIPDDGWNMLLSKCLYVEEQNPVKVTDFDQILKQQNPNKAAGFDKAAYQKAKDDLLKRLENTGKPKNYFVPTAVLALMFTLGKFQLLLFFLVGWLLTGIAISMGASFWFDLLNKLIDVRNTGSRPPSSSNQTTAK